MPKDIRFSASALKVLMPFVEAPHERRSGAEIARVTKVGSSTLYPLLARFEAVGWMTSEWEAVDPSIAGRPRRRLYKLTAAGQAAALKALADVQLPAGTLAWAP